MTMIIDTATALFCIRRPTGFGPLPLRALPTRVTREEIRTLFAAELGYRH